MPFISTRSFARFQTRAITSLSCITLCGATLGLAPLVKADTATDVEPQATATNTTFDFDAPVDLAPHWQIGQAARYRFTTQLRQTVKVTLGDRQREKSTDTDIAGELSWTVDRVAADGQARCTMTLDWMSIDTTRRVQGNEVKSTVDSRKPAPAKQKLMHNLMRAMAGQPLNITVAPDGQVTQIKGLDAMKARADEPDLVPDALDFEETASGLAAFAAAPPPVISGDTFNATFRWNHDLGHVDEDWTFKLESIENLGNVPVATISGTATSELDIDPEHLKTPEGAPPIKIRLTQREASTQILMDLLRHEAVGRHSRVVECVTFDVKLPDGVFRREITETNTSQLIRLSP